MKQETVESAMPLFQVKLLTTNTLKHFKFITNTSTSQIEKNFECNLTFYKSEYLLSYEVISFSQSDQGVI